MILREHLNGRIIIVKPSGMLWGLDSSSSCISFEFEKFVS
jgi:hypothetical protein